MKLKITDEKLDELAAADFRVSGYVPTEWALINHKRGFRAAEQMHQAKFDTAMHIIEMQYKSLHYYSKQEFDRVCFLDHATCEEEYGQDARNSIVATDKMMKELKGEL